MKNVSVKILAGVGALSIAAAVYSFASNDNPGEKDERKKYEVVRMVDGEAMEFDTIVAASSDYTPQDYLNDLGFGEDENVNIIDMTQFDLENMMTFHHTDGTPGKEDCEKMIFIEMDEESTNSSEDGEHEIRIEKNVEIDNNGNIVRNEVENGEENVIIEKIIIDENGNDVEIKHESGEGEVERIIINESGDIGGNEKGEKEIRIEKRIVFSEDGKESEEIEVNVEALTDQINIDSLIKAELAKEGVDKDGENVFVHKMIISDERVEGDESMEWQEVDTEGATYHKKMDGPGHKMEVAVWGEEMEDFTLVIVSNPDETPTRTTGTDEESSIKEMKLFPNPSSSTTQLQLNFEDKAKTTIAITDMNGKVVEKMDLGKFKGQFNHDIDVKSWNSGVYMIHVNHGGDQLIEKLIVE